MSASLESQSYFVCFLYLSYVLMWLLKLGAQITQSSVTGTNHMGPSGKDTAGALRGSMPETRGIYDPRQFSQF